MLYHAKILFLIASACVLFGLRVDAVAQSGRLLGVVAYSAPGLRPGAAVGVRVVAVGAYSQSETRTDNTGSFALILRPGAYRIVAQGAYPYVQYQSVTGYVSANANSYISPNPIYLVPGRRSSNSAPRAPYGQVAPWNVLAILAHETASNNNDAVEVGNLGGSVRLKQSGRPVRNALVTAIGPFRSGQDWTDQNGDFLIKSLPPGKYSISVQVRSYPHYQPEVDVEGYVRPRGDSKVSPNPILLVPK